MATLKIFKRDRKALSTLLPGDTFKFCGKDAIYKVVDLTKVDGFNLPSPVLRDDVTYCIGILSGEVCIHQNILEVEIVELDMREIINVAST